MIAQTVQFTGISPETLYTAYLSSREHSAMTAGSRPAFFFRPSVGEVAHGQEGDELRAFGFTGADGQPQFSLHARILQRRKCLSNLVGSQLYRRKVFSPG